MPVELLVILGAEASILAFVVAMSLHTKRMDVLSGRSFEHPIVAPEGNRRSARSPDQEARDLMRFTGRWASIHSLRQISSGTPINRMLRRILPIWPQTPVLSETRARGTGTPAPPGASDRPAVLSEAGRDTDAERKGAGPEHMQSSAAAILHQLSAP